MATNPGQVVKILAQTYPNATCALDYQGPFQLLVATVLSAQTTDQRVNTVTPTLFERWPSPTELAAAHVADVESVLRPLGFQKRRAGQITALAQDIESTFGGTVPDTHKALESLPGVGRKTANVVLGNYFGGSYLTVDTHVGRISRRLGWATTKNPKRAEQQIVDLLAKWSVDVNLTKLSHQLIDHGRTICMAKTPQCRVCPLAPHCPRLGL